jgi:hypothetical protein
MASIGIGPTRGAPRFQTVSARRRRSRHFGLGRKALARPDPRQGLLTELVHSRLGPGVVSDRDGVSRVGVTISFALVPNPARFTAVARAELLNHSMRAWANHRHWLAVGLLVVSTTGCGKSKPAPSVASPDAVSPNTDTSRFVPRRANPLIVTNRITLVQQAQASVTNNTPPVVTCAVPQSLPCMSPDGTQATLTAHVEDVDGNALSVTWSIDGRERYAQQVPAGGPPTSTDLAFTYNFTPGDHAIKVTVSDGTLSAACETAMSFQRDTQNPTIVCSRDILTGADPGSCSAIVTFSPKATDNCPDVAVACEPPSGSAFPIGTTRVTCTATDAAGNAADCAFAVTVQVINRCPQNDGFWRQNPGAWPLNSMTLGNQVYTRTQLLPLLRATVQADASMLLARQLIAATLNTANGSDPRPICAQLAQANGVLTGFPGKLPFRVNVSSAAGRAMIDLSQMLNGYNNGMVTADCVP